MMAEQDGAELFIEAMKGRNADQLVFVSAARVDGPPEPEYALTLGQVLAGMENMPAVDVRPAMAKSALNIRPEPNDKLKRIGLIEAGARFWVESKQVGDYFKLRGQEGYVLARLVK
jgi:hypothetical protein